MSAGCLRPYDGVTQFGLVEVNTSDGTVIPAFNMHLRPDFDPTATTGYGAYDGEDPISLSVGPNPSEILVGCGGHAPAWFVVERGEPRQRDDGCAAVEVLDDR